jgi:anti-sigma B factor antagonist
MAEQSPPLSVLQEKDIRIVEFTSTRILDEANITEIGNVDHLSSAALGMLINANNRIKQRNGQLRLANIKPQIYEVFVITKLNRLFKIFPDRKEALASFDQ